MIGMKKVLFALLIIILVVLTTSSTFSAVATKPHVVVGESVWLYDSSGQKLFLLPPTYYAEITSMDDYYYYVTFNGISGRVKKEDVTTTGYHAVAKGTMRELKVSSDYAEFSSILLKKTPDLSAQDVSNIPVSATFSYLGSFPVDDQIWYAVKWEQYFGYLRATRTNTPTMVIEDFVPEALPQEPDEPQEEEEPTNPPSIESNGENLVETPDESQDNTLKIILIIGLIIPAVLIIFLIFKPQSRSSKDV